MLHHHAMHLQETFGKGLDGQGDYPQRLQRQAVSENASQTTTSQLQGQLVNQFQSVCSLLYGSMINANQTSEYCINAISSPGKMSMPVLMNATTIGMNNDFFLVPDTTDWSNWMLQITLRIFLQQEKCGDPNYYQLLEAPLYWSPSSEFRDCCIFLFPQLGSTQRRNVEDPNYYQLLEAPLTVGAELSLVVKVAPGFCIMTGDGGGRSSC